MNLSRATTGFAIALTLAGCGGPPQPVVDDDPSFERELNETLAPYLSDLPTEKEAKDSSQSTKGRVRVITQNGTMISVYRATSEQPFTVLVTLPNKTEIRSDADSTIITAADGITVDQKKMYITNMNPQLQRTLDGLMAAASKREEYQLSFNGYFKKQPT